MIVSVPGLVRDGSGIGVLQRHVYPLLEEQGIVLTMLPTRDHGNTVLSRARGAATAALAIPKGDVYLALVTPIPLRLPVPMVGFVHDLRWRRTRGRLAQRYRHLDFKRTMRNSAVVLTISAAVCDEIAEVDPENAHKVRVVHSGPGQAGAIDFAPKKPGRVALIGGGAHKRNELAVQALVSARPDWMQEITAINLSRQAISVARSAGLTVRAHSRLSEADFIAELGAAEYFVHLGVEEGFGLPYVEALALGCQVVAIAQPLTQEILGDAAILIRNGPLTDLAQQLRQARPVSEDKRRAVAERYSWSIAAEQVAEAVRAAAGRVTDELR